VVHLQISHRRFLFFVLGILILTLGIALTIQSKLGTSPFDALLVGLYKTFGLSIGSWEIVVGLSMVMLNALGQWRRPEYWALLTSLITGICIDFWLIIGGGWVHPDTIIPQFICLILGIVLSGLGIAIYLQADFAPNPIDRSMLVVQHLTGLNLALSRMIINVVLVVLAFAFNGPIGIGTIITALISGAIIKWFMPYGARLVKGAPKPNTWVSS
jgi:uncharacterized membrane protein YczE